MSRAEPFLSETGDGFSVSYRSRSLYAPAQPATQARRRAAAVAVTKDTLFVVPSPLLLYGVDTLLDRIDQSSRILCIERDERLMDLTHRSPLRRVLADSRVICMRADSVASVLGALPMEIDWGFRRVMPVFLTGGYRLSREFYDEVLDTLSRRNAEIWKNRITIVRMARLWIPNILYNLACFPVHAIPVTNCSNSPIVVVGAGPSLEEALPWLKTMSTRLPIVCADTALPVLLAEGLIPDIVVVLEGQHANINDFLPPCRISSPNRPVLFADLSSAPSVLRATGRSPRFFLSHFASLALFDRLERASLLPPMIPPLGSVGTAAVWICRQITTGPVIMAGLDFSYQTGKSHASGTPSHRELLRSTTRTTSVERQVLSHVARHTVRYPGKDGSEVRTDIVLHGYASPVEELAIRRGRLYDTNPRSILNGVARVSFEQAENLVHRFADSAETEHLLAVCATPASDETEQRTRVLDMLNEERALLSRARTLISHQLAQAEGETADDLDEVLGTVSYLYFDFPDVQARSFSDPACLSRIAVSSAFYGQVLERAIIVARPGAEATRPS